MGEDSMKSDKEKKSIFKKLLQSLTFPRGGRRLQSASEMVKTPAILPRSKTWSCPPTTPSPTSKTCKAKRQHGCFSVYVGEEKQKFSVKAEYANHPLFKILLEDAEMEYGFSSGGPLVIPCEVDLFYKVLAEMDSAKEMPYSSGCGFAYGSCSPFNPSRRLGRNSDLAKGYGSYAALTPSRLLKINHF